MYILLVHAYGKNLAHFLCIKGEMKTMDFVDVVCMCASVWLFFS